MDPHPLSLPLALHRSSGNPRRKRGRAGERGSCGPPIPAPGWSPKLELSPQIRADQVPGPVPGAGLGKPTSIRHLPLSLGRTEQRCPPRRPRAGLRSGPPQLQGWTVACVGGCAVHRRMFSTVSDFRSPVPVAVARLPPSSSPHGLLRMATGHDSWPSPRQLIQEQGRGQSAC